MKECDPRKCAGVGVRLGWGGAEAETFMAGLPAPSDKRQNFDGFNPLSWAKGLCMNVVAQRINCCESSQVQKSRAWSRSKQEISAAGTQWEKGEPDFAEEKGKGTGMKDRWGKTGLVTEGYWSRLLEGFWLLAG